MANRLFCFFVLLAAALIAALGDTPANCSYEDALGTWRFYIGPAGFDNRLNCSKPFSPRKTLEVSLGFPDLAVDQFGNQGLWTLVYNQGFEVVVYDTNRH